jgi:hypothetical protein
MIAPSMARGIDALQAHELREPGAVLVGGALGLGAQAKLRDDAIAVEQRELAVGVADIDRQQHARPPIRRGAEDVAGR